MDKEKKTCLPYFKIKKNLYNIKLLGRYVSWLGYMEKFGHIKLWLHDKHMAEKVIHKFIIIILKPKQVLNIDIKILVLF